MRWLLVVLLVGCAAEKSAESPGSASPRDKRGIGGSSSGIVEDPCAGGQITTGMNGHTGSGEVAVPGPAEEEPSVTGDIDRAVVMRVVRARLGAIRKCYDAQPSQTELKVSVTFTIAVDGSVPKAVATGGAQPLMDCIAAVFRALKFPTSPAEVRITYPLTFRPG